MEKNLLKTDQLRSMTEAKKIDDVFSVLQNAGYGVEGSQLSIDNFELALKGAEQDLFAEIDELSKEDEIFNIFKYPSDYHNIKVLLKAEALGTERNDILVGTGTIKPQEMVRIVNERDKSSLTEYMAEGLEEAIDTHARTKDPQAIDFILDKYCFMDIARVADESGNKFAKGYVALLIDTLNLKTFMRVKKMGQPWTYFANVFIPGGNVDQRSFVNGYDEDIKHAAERFAPFDIGEAATKGIESVIEHGTFTELERMCDNVLMDYVRAAKLKTFGVEPLIAFIVSKQMEIKCLRILLSGKLADMEPEAIRERMRIVYE